MDTTIINHVSHHPSKPLRPNPLAYSSGDVSARAGPSPFMPPSSHLAQGAGTSPSLHRTGYFHQPYHYHASPLGSFTPAAPAPGTGSCFGVLPYRWDHPPPSHQYTFYGHHAGVIPKSFAPGDLLSQKLSSLMVTNSRFTPQQPTPPLGALPPPSSTAAIPSPTLAQVIRAQPHPQQQAFVQQGPLEQQRPPESLLQNGSQVMTQSSVESPCEEILAPSVPEAESENQASDAERADPQQGSTNAYEEEEDEDEATNSLSAEGETVQSSLPNHNTMEKFQQELEYVQFHNNEEEDNEKDASHLSSSSGLFVVQSESKGMKEEGERSSSGCSNPSSSSSAASSDREAATDLIRMRTESGNSQQHIVKCSQECEGRKDKYHTVLLSFLKDEVISSLFRSQFNSTLDTALTRQRKKLTRSNHDAQCPVRRLNLDKTADLIALKLDVQGRHDSAVVRKNVCRVGLMLREVSNLFMHRSSNEEEGALQLSLDAESLAWAILVEALRKKPISLTVKAEVLS